jgi:hypothetical protein
MAIHVVARGALIGGGVGAALAALRGGKAEGEGAGSEVVRFAKSIAEGALAGAGVGFLLDRRSRAQASALLAQHGPTVLDAVTELAEVAVHRAAELVDTARPVVAEALDAARPTVTHAIDAARPTVVHALDAARPVVLDAYEAARHRAATLRAA